MEKSWFGDAIRAILAQLDKVVYGFISIFYDIILKIAEINVFKEGAIEETATRLYTLIGLFMLFKVSFSFINYIINPDSLNDKEKGGGNLIKHIVISFVMIIITPYCFNFLTEAQEAILKDQIIPNFILGTNWQEGSSNTFKISDECPNEVQITHSGDYIALMSFSPFYQLETEEGYDQSKREEILNDYCGATKVKELLSGDIYKSGKKDGLYTVNYNIFISTVVGVVVALLFLGFCMDVAVRAIKLGFLEIISPIPIISYIDPSKSASGMFKKWLSEVGRTWASLFIRLISVFFAIFIISNINYSEIKENTWYVSLFIIIGALMFAKQLPKLIENILGIKLDGGFQLNPLKKIGDQTLGCKAIVSGVNKIRGMALGGIAGGIAGFRAGQQVGAGLRGTIIGIGSGMNSGMKTPKGAFGNSLNQTYKNLTGNEFSCLTASGVIMGMGKKADESMAEINIPLNRGREQLRQEQTRLNIASTTSSNLGLALTQKGYDTNNLNRDDINQNISNFQSTLSRLGAKITADTESMNNKKSTYDSYKSFVDNYVPTAIHDDGTPIYSSEYEQKKNALSTLTSEISALENTISADQNTYQRTQQKLNDQNDMIRYLDAVEQENKSRAKIGKIEKSISTLQNEKKQREKFYQYDSSPKNDVNSAINQFGAASESELSAEAERLRNQRRN